MLEIRNVTKRYIGTTAVNDVSMRLEKGRIALLLGPNGSGKTTLMKMIAGLTRPDSGDITLDGESIGVETKRRVCYMPTENYFYNYMKVGDIGAYFADFFADFDRRAFEEAMTRENIALGTKVRALSSGMAAKVRLAAALSRASDITMLDEPLNGVDLIARDRVISQVAKCREEKRGLLISTHLVDEMELLTDDMYFMKNGSLVLSGTYKELCTNTGRTAAELYREIYGSEAEIYA